MPQTEPVAPPTKPHQPNPQPAPQAPDAPPPQPKPEPDPFKPDWPETRPTPPPKGISNVLGLKPLEKVSRFRLDLLPKSFVS
ncbi:MAG: hypothetical protein L0Y58_12970 [Verrucomicrobia subdivision 3 bacterium]|nr:hypothetical protein [Limisphaerales bacterium]